MGHEVIVFCALETYSLTGGLQQFNRRAIRHLARIMRSAPTGELRVILMRDRANDAPGIDGVCFKCSGKSRILFFIRAVASCWAARVLILGHINTLPIAALVKILRPDIRILLFVHGDEVWGDPEYRRKRFLEQFLLCAVDRILSVSDYTAKRMGKAYDLPEAKFGILPNAVDPVASSVRRFEGPPTILSVTRLGKGDRAKNIDCVLRAFAKILSEIPNAIYEVVGEGPLRPELEKLADKLEIAHSVRFLGRVDNLSLDEAYNRANVFVLPSSKEGFGIVFLEAWQHRLPVICSTFGAPPRDGI
jgi:phosphatidyl-myo-inositol dimannoside synthase